MYLYKILASLLCYIISTISFAHVAGITDTAINVDKHSINIVYTLPIDNIKEFSNEERSSLTDTIIQGFLVENEVETQAKIEAKVCNGEFISKYTLANIQSEQFHIRYTCDKQLLNLSISYSLLFSQDDSHKNYVRLSIAGRSQSFTYSSSKKTHVLPIDKLILAWSVTNTQNNQSIKNNHSITVSEQLQGSNSTTTFIERLLQ